MDRGNYGESKHHQIMYGHIRNTTLESILEESLKMLISKDNLPDQPYGLLYRNVLFSKLKKELKEELFKATEAYKGNELGPLGKFGITHVADDFSVFGLAHLVQFIDIANIDRLKRSLLDFIRPDHRTSTQEFGGGSNTWIYHAIGGAMILRSKLLTGTDGSPDPLTIFSVINIEGENFEEVYKPFFDYMYNDMLSLTNLENDFHIFESFRIEETVTINNKESKTTKKFSLQDIQQYRSQFMIEVRNALTNGFPMYLKVLLRMKNPDTILGETLEGGSTQMLIDSGEFIYIIVKKEYILHRFKQFAAQGGSTIGRNSTAAMPCQALLEGIFFNKEDAEDYAAYYYKATENPLDKTKLRGFLEHKFKYIIENYEKANMIDCLWHLLSVTLLDVENIRKQILPSFFQALSYYGAQLYATKLKNKIIKFLVKEYNQTRQIVYKQAAETIFSKYKEETRAIFSSGFCGDAIAFKRLIETLFFKLSRSKSQELEFDNFTLHIIESLNIICITIGNSLLAQLCRMNKIINDTLQSVLKRAGGQGIAHIMTYQGLLIMKKPKYMVNFMHEMVKNIKLKSFPPGQEEEHVYLQYLVDTEVYENLYFMLRDLFFNPTYPNTLAIVEFKFQTLLAKYTIYQKSDADIEKENIQIVHHNKNPPENLYFIGSDDMREKNIPFSMGQEYILQISSPIDVGTFRREFAICDINRMEMKLELNYSMRPILSIAGVSILNGSHRIQSSYAQWDMSYDILITGPDINGAFDTYISLLINYMRFLNELPTVIMLGIYDIQDPIEPLVKSDIFLDSPTNQQAAFRNLKYSQETKHRIYLPVYIKFMNIFAQANIYFNMHYSDKGKINYTSVLPLTTVQDQSKIFFSVEDFTLWDQILQSSKLSLGEWDFITTEINENYASANINKALKQILIKTALDSSSNPEYFNNLFRTLYSHGEMFYNLGRMSEIVAGLFTHRENGKNSGHSKVIDTEIKGFFDIIKKTVDTVIYDDSCCFLEGEQPNILNIINQITTFFTLPTENQTYSPNAKLAKILARLFHTICNNNLLVLIDIFEVRHGIKLSSRKNYLYLE